MLSLVSSTGQLKSIRLVTFIVVVVSRDSLRVKTTFSFQIRDVFQEEFEPATQVALDQQKTARNRRLARH